MESVRYTDFDKLLNQGVADFSMEDSELTACKNVWVYKIGKLEKVPGYEKATSDQMADNVNFLHYYYQSSTGTNRLIAGGNSGNDYVLKYRTTGDWSTLNTYSDKNDVNISMVDYLDKLFVAGHDGSDYISNATIDGTTYSESDSDLDDMPKGKFLVRYRDLLYVLNTPDHPSRAYFCKNPTSGSIDWATDDTNFVSFGFDDGDVITAATNCLDRLVVFKNYSMWTYDENSRSRIADIGCENYRSLAKINNVLYWANRHGIYRWEGEYPEFISAKVQPFFDNLTSTDQYVATIYDNEEYRLFVGTVTVEGIKYENAWICFNTRRETFYIRCTYDTAESACNYIENGKDRTYFGTDNGYVMKFANKVDGVYSDDGNEIDSFFITRAFDYGAPEDNKNTNYITIFSRYANNMKCYIESDGDNKYSKDYTPIKESGIYGSEISVSGNRIKYKFYEKSSAKSWEFEGFVVRADIKAERYI